MFALHALLPEVCTKFLLEFAQFVNAAEVFEDSFEQSVGLLPEELTLFGTTVCALDLHEALDGVWHHARFECERLDGFPVGF